MSARAFRGILRIYSHDQSFSKLISFYPGLRFVYMNSAKRAKVQSAV